MATHSSILAWKIPWTEEPGRLQFMVSQRIGHDLVTASACNAGEPGSIPGSGRSPGEGQKFILWGDERRCAGLRKAQGGNET